MWVFGFCCVAFFFLSPKVSCPRKQTQLSPNHLWFSNKERWQAKLGLLFSYYHKQSAKPQHSTVCFFGCFKMACDRKQSLYVTVYLSTSAVGFNKCCLSLYSLAGLFWGIAHHCEIWKFKRRNHEREYLISLAAVSLPQLIYICKSLNLWKIIGVAVCTMHSWKLDFNKCGLFST